MTAKQIKEADADEAIARLRADVERESRFLEPYRTPNYFKQAANAKPLTEEEAQAFKERFDAIKPGEIITGARPGEVTFILGRTRKPGEIVEDE